MRKHFTWSYISFSYDTVNYSKSRLYVFPKQTYIVTVLSLSLLWFYIVTVLSLSLLWFSFFFRFFTHMSCAWPEFVLINKHYGMLSMSVQQTVSLDTNLKFLQTIPLLTVQIQVRRLVTCRFIRITVCFLLLIFDRNPYLQQWMCPNSEIEESMSETRGWKGLTKYRHEGQTKSVSSSLAKNSSAYFSSKRKFCRNDYTEISLVSLQ